MEVLANEKGRGVYARKEYCSWDLIHVEKAIFSISSICNKQYIDMARKNKDQHDQETFIHRMLKYIASAPDSKIKNQQAQLKLPLLYLLNGGRVNQISHLAKTSELDVTDKQIRNTAKTFKISKEDLKLVTQIVQANAFSVPGLFFTDIGMSLFDQGSMFNHSCNPNAFTFITYDKIMIYAGKPIAIDEEITISYKPLCVPDPSNYLTFECKCGSCHTTSSILKETFESWSQPQNMHERIDYMLKRCNEIPSAEHIQLLIESYYEVWLKHNTYREKYLYEVLQKFESKEPNTTWLECCLLKLILASRLGFSDHLPDILDKLLPFIQNKDIIEHIVVVSTLIPHIYHSCLIEILGTLNLLP